MRITLRTMKSSQLTETMTLRFSKQERRWIKRNSKMNSGGNDSRFIRKIISAAMEADKEQNRSAV
jgi:hypothetical protein